MYSHDLEERDIMLKNVHFTVLLFGAVLDTTLLFFVVVFLKYLNHFLIVFDTTDGVSYLLYIFKFELPQQEMSQLNVYLTI